MKNWKNLNKNWKLRKLNIWKIVKIEKNKLKNENLKNWENWKFGKNETLENLINWSKIETFRTWKNVMSRTPDKKGKILAELFIWLITDWFWTWLSFCLRLMSIKIEVSMSSISKAFSAFSSSPLDIRKLGDSGM